MAHSTPHKPRRKPRRYVAEDSLSTIGAASIIWSARTGKEPWFVLPVILMVVALFRWGVSLWDYSGFQAEPMHGDFEAQRHWMEITTKLPISQWYFYDLQWWGLDYPPLTAYHSWLLGKIGDCFSKEWFALDTSRGTDDPMLKIYMRVTVLVSEYIFYVPAVVILVRKFARQQGVSHWEGSVALILILLQPGTLLIDHGHFQYNTVMLGLVTSFSACVAYDKLALGCVFFVGALGFKQMALYYAPAVFAYLLGSCFFPRLDPLRLILIGVSTVVSFAAVFAPLLGGAYWEAQRGSLSAPGEVHNLLSFLPKTAIDSSATYYPPLHVLAQAIHRIFPFARGLFEDKVANFWCAISTASRLSKIVGRQLQERYGPEILLYIDKLDVRSQPEDLMKRIALITTVGAIFVPCVILFLRPQKKLLSWGLASVSWGFFLFSFQVHEKSVLLPLLPMTLLLAHAEGLSPYIRAWVAFANLLGTWTMFPLLKRDGLQIPYAACSLLWAYLVGAPPLSFDLYKGSTIPLVDKAFHISTYVLMLAWHVVEANIEPPPGKPDLWLVVNVLIGFVGFVVCYLWCCINLVQKSGLLGR